MYDVSPYSEQSIFSDFNQDKSFSKHLLTIYSIAVGLNAKKIVDLGIGTTTRALRMAAARTGGVVYSCDVDVARFSELMAQQDAHWKFFIGASEKFLDQLEGPLDFVMHDAAHDYYQVKMDIERILPKMKRFGIICVHDTQQIDLSQEMLAALKDGLRGQPISITNLPYSSGLAIIRVEESAHPAIVPSTGTLADGRKETVTVPCPTMIAEAADFANADTSVRRWLHWRARKIIKGS